MGYSNTRNEVFEQINSNLEILKKIKNNLVEDLNNDIDCIALSDVLSLIKENHDCVNKRVNAYNVRLNECIKFRRDYSKIIIYGFNYNTAELKTSVRCDNGIYHRIKFSKRNGELYVTQSESLFAYNVLQTVNDILSECYDFFKQYSDFYQQRVYNIKSVNSIFCANIDAKKVKLYLNDDDNLSSIRFELNAYCDKNKFDCICDSIMLNILVKCFEEKLFDKIFVKIDDCPKWSKDALCEIRHEQLKKVKRKKLIIKK